MANFDLLAKRGQAIFLTHPQAPMLRRFGLSATADAIFLNFCGDPYEIDRQTGEVRTGSGAPAGPSATLAMFDMLCGEDPGCGLAGTWCSTNTLPGGGQSSPDDVALHRGCVDRFSRHLPALRAACAEFSSFPVGDAACEFPVFDWFPAVFQFFQGDDEFPSSVHFLWDRSTLRYLHYETLYYIMGCFLTRLLSKLPD